MRKTSIQIELPHKEERIKTIEKFLNENNFSYKKSDIDGTNSDSLDTKKLGQKGLEVLELMSQGLTYEDIAVRLGITIDGVRYYVKKIYKALDVRNNISAVAYYLKHYHNN